ncbi:MAG: MFS transporter [Candidatus Riflebacteria bacterium]|nr:MFS transporter [Candidatus Riflebacteria bacterium]
MPQWFPVAMCFLWYLLTTASVYLIMPIRGAMLMTNFGPSVLPWTFMANAITTGLAVWVYGRYAHLPRKKLIGGTLTVIWSTLLFWVIAAMAAQKIAWVSFLFSLWTDIFLILAVTVFWSTIDDIFTLESAKTNFGMVTAAGPLGAIIGSYVGNALIHKIGPSGMMVLAALTFALILPIFSFLDRWAESNNAEGKKTETVRKIQDFSQFIEVGKSIISSKFLFFITLAVCFECIVPNLMTYILSTEMALAYPKVEDMAQAFALFFLLTNTIGFFVSVFLTSWIFKRLGVGGAMATCVLASFGGLLFFAIWPFLVTCIAGKTLEDLMRFTLYRSAKEALYTVTSREVVYRAKAYIEVFIYRLCSGASGIILLLLTSERFCNGNPRTVAIVGVPLVIAWFLTTTTLGRTFLQMKEQIESKKSIPGNN